MKLLTFLGLLTVSVFAVGVVQAQELEPIALNSFAGVPDGIRMALVRDQEGRTLGIVSRLKLQANGKLRQIDVLMPGGRHMVINAGSASYDAYAHRVIVNLTAIQNADATRDLGVMGSAAAKYPTVWTPILLGAQIDSPASQ